MEEKLPFELPTFDNVKEDNTDLGTFKSVKTLKEAYDSLRSCFTKNAMELAEIKKNMAQNVSLEQNSEKQEELCAKSDNDCVKSIKTSENDVKNDDFNAFKADILENNEEESAEKLTSDKAFVAPDNSDKVQAPEQKVGFWDNAEWSQKVEKFFKDNPSAQKYSNEIAKELMQDKEMLSSVDPLLQAWARVLEKSSKNIDLSDEFIEKNIISNPKIKNLIIQNYLSELKTYRSAPSVIASVQGSANRASPRKNVADMAQAKELAKKLFQ